MAAVFRAIVGYCFLVFMVRILHRRPGRQLTPFEFVVIFFVGGLTLTAMVGDDASITNALCQIVTVAAVHYLFVWMRAKSSRFARIVDGTPLVLLDKGRWRTETLANMDILDDDVMTFARSQAIPSLERIEYAVLERNAEISIIKAKQSEGGAT